MKARAVLTHSFFLWQHEPCFVGWVQGNMPKRKPPSNVSTVWNVDQRFEQMGIHPTQKPVELFIRPIEYHTDPGEIVYEPFSGSGTQISRRRAHRPRLLRGRAGTRPTST